ncbi:MAG: SufE family protein [Muribaculaceae bacterium]|nr:SufE family protein [Muribaculaceae bacterium]
MTIDQIQQDIIERFADFDDWMDKYSLIIDMGNALDPIPEELKTPDRIIEGCQSRVWLDAEEDADGNVVFRADSDAIIVKGIISMLIEVLSGHKPDEILNADLHFIKDIGLDEHLSPTRSNGLVAMLKQMRAYAAAFKLKHDNQ